MSIRSVQTSYALLPTPSSALNTHVLGSLNMNHPRSSPFRYDHNQEKYPPGIGRSGRRRSGGFTPSNAESSGNVVDNVSAIRRPGLSRLPYASGKRSMVSSFSSPAPPPPSAQGSRTGEFPKGSGRKTVSLDGEAQASIAARNRSSTRAKASFTTSEPEAIQPPVVNLGGVPLLPTASRPRLPVLPPLDKDASAKLVADILLNRIYAVGKPMRRKLPTQCRKEYTKSGLSSVISIEC